MKKYATGIRYEGKNLPIIIKVEHLSDCIMGSYPAIKKKECNCAEILNDRLMVIEKKLGIID